MNRQKINKRYDRVATKTCLYIPQGGSVVIPNTYKGKRFRSIEMNVYLNTLNGDVFRYGSYTLSAEDLGLVVDKWYHVCLSGGRLFLNGSYSKDIGGVPIYSNDLVFLDDVDGYIQSFRAYDSVLRDSDIKVNVNHLGEIDLDLRKHILIDYDFDLNQGDLARSTLYTLYEAEIAGDVQLRSSITSKFVINNSAYVATDAGYNSGPSDINSIEVQSTSINNIELFAENQNIIKLDIKKSFIDQGDNFTIRLAGSYVTTTGETQDIESLLRDLISKTGVTIGQTRNIDFGVLEIEPGQELDNLILQLESRSWNVLNVIRLEGWELLTTNTTFTINFDTRGVNCCPTANKGEILEDNPIGLCTQDSCSNDLNVGVTWKPGDVELGVSDSDITHTYSDGISAHIIEFLTTVIGQTSRLDLSSQGIKDDIDFSQFSNLYWLDLSDNPDIDVITYGNWINKDCRIVLKGYDTLKLEELLNSINVQSTNDVTQSLDRSISVGSIIIDSPTFAPIIQALLAKNWKIETPVVEVITIQPVTNSFSIAVNIPNVAAYPLLLRQTIGGNPVDYIINNNNISIITLADTSELTLYMSVIESPPSITELNLAGAMGIPNISDVGDMSVLTGLTVLDISNNNGLRNLLTTDLVFAPNPNIFIDIEGTYDKVDTSLLLDILETKGSSLGRVININNQVVLRNEPLWLNKEVLIPLNWTITTIIGRVLQFSSDEPFNFNITITNGVAFYMHYSDNGDIDDFTDWGAVMGNSTGNNFTGAGEAYLGMEQLNSDVFAQMRDLDINNSDVKVIINEHVTPAIFDTYDISFNKLTVAGATRGDRDNIYVNTEEAHASTIAEESMITAYNSFGNSNTGRSLDSYSVVDALANATLATAYDDLSTNNWDVNVFVISGEIIYNS